MFKEPLPTAAQWIERKGWYIFSKKGGGVIGSEKLIIFKNE